MRSWCPYKSPHVLNNLAYDGGDLKKNLPQNNEGVCWLLTGTKMSPNVLRKTKASSISLKKKGQLYLFLFLSIPYETRAHVSMDGNWKTYQVKALRATYISDISAGMTSMITQRIWSVSHTCILPLNYDIFDSQKQNIYLYIRSCKLNFP
jgi:hypothetical protein